MKINLTSKFLYEFAYGGMLTLLIMLGALVTMSAFGIPSQLRIFAVQSGSMEPAIKTGGLVFVQPQDEYEIGDVVTYASRIESREPITHRIIDIEDSVYITKGDANESADVNPVRHDSVLGRVAFHIPFLGYPVAFAKTQMGFVLLIVIPATIIVYSEILVLKKEIVKKLKERKQKNVTSNETPYE